MIVAVRREHPELLDYDVDGALEALVGRYGAEARGREPRPVALPGLRQTVFDAVLSACEWRRGRPVSGLSDVATGDEVKTAEEIVACLKRIRGSVQGWTKRGGR